MEVLPLQPDPHEQPALDDIAEHGWSGIIVKPSEHEPGFEYTVGLMATLDHPEVIVFGLSRQTSHDLLWEIIHGIRAGRSFLAPGPYDHVLEDLPLQCRDVDESQHAWYLGYAIWHRRHVGQIGTLRAVQCVWPDALGRFPGEPGCDPEVVRLQPDLRIVRPDQPAA